MSEEQMRGDGTAIREIERKVRLSIAVGAFVVITLFSVILYHLFPPVSEVFSFLPDISISLIIAISFFLAVLGLGLSIRISRQVIRMVRDYSHRLERLLDITCDLREEIYGDILLEKILDSAMSITSADAGSILLREEDRLTFKIVRGEKSAALIGTSVNLGQGITGWVAETRKPVRLENVRDDARFDPAVDSMTGYTTRSILCLPLVTRSNVIGVIELLNKRDTHSFRQRDEEIMTYLAGQAAISISKTRFYEDQKNYEIHLTGMLIEAIDVHIVEKQGHSRRVARYSTMIAKALAMTEEEQRKVYQAALLHDIGFMKISPEDSYRKEEYMRHPVLGFEMIKPVTFYAGIAPCILHHHERYDGHGYPSQLKGEEIPLESRIIAIAEAFDAMVSAKSYKVPMSFDEAILELRHKAGTQFDRELVQIFTTTVEPQHIKE